MIIEKDAKQLILLFNATFGVKYNVELMSDSDEPEYRACKDSNKPNVINFANGYRNSALHEIAHWVIAGVERRKQQDYGYWYAEDGRSAEQQQLFQQLEVYPQAIEKAFCEALGWPFSASIDNLNQPSSQQQIEKFESQIDAKKRQLENTGFPPRAQQFLDALSGTLAYA